LSTRSLNAVGGAFSSRMFLSARQTFRQTLGDTERALGIGTVYQNYKKQVTEQLQGLSLRVAFNQVTQVKSFIALGHNVNEFDVDGDRTPLHWAAARGFRRCVVLLLEAGADKTARDAQGRTPAELALDCDQFEIGDIIKYGPPIDDVKKSTGNEGPISQLCLGNKTRELASMLRAYNLEKDPGIRETISVNLRDPDGDRFPLHWAAARGLRTCVNLLVDAGAHIGAQHHVR
jgi:ankyrin repeat protein